MFEITLTYNRKTLNNFKFDKESIIIGRDSTCDVQIDNVGVSRHHARIEKNGDIYMVLDLGSGNGTFIRGKRVTKHNLNDGDEISIWNYSIYFRLPHAKTAGREEAAKSDMKKQDLDMTIAIDPKQLERKQRERASGIAAYLSYQVPNRGTRTHSLMRTVTFFGTGPKCEFKTSGWFYQPRHAMIVRDESGFRFINCSAKKMGTVNGHKVDDGRLKNEDVIQIGHQTYKFFIGLPSSL